MARRLRADLERRGVVVWLDEAEIRVGDSISEKVQQGLDTADFVLVLLSRHSVASGWVRKEWQSMITLEAQTGRTIILPVKIEPCDIPPLLADKRHADLSVNYRAAFEELVLALRLTAETSQTSFSYEEALTYEKRLDRYHASDCFVRDPELDNAMSIVLHGHFLAVVGERGAGKTEVLRRIVEHVNQADVAKAALVDVIDVGNAGESEFCRSLVMAALGRDPREIDWWEAEDLLFQAAQSSKPLVLCVDNISALPQKPWFTPDMLVRFRALLTSSAGRGNQLSMVVSSDIGLHEIDSDRRSFASPWHNMFPIVQLGELSEKRSIRLLRGASLSDGAAIRYCLDVARRRLPLDLLLLADITSRHQFLDDEAKYSIRSTYNGVFQALRAFA